MKLDRTSMIRKIRNFSYVIIFVGIGMIIFGILNLSVGAASLDFGDEDGPPLETTFNTMIFLVIGGMFFMIGLLLWSGTSFWLSSVIKDRKGFT